MSPKHIFPGEFRLLAKVSCCLFEYMKLQSPALSKFKWDQESKKAFCSKLSINWGGLDNIWQQLKIRKPQVVPVRLLYSNQIFTTSLFLEVYISCFVLALSSSNRKPSCLDPRAINNAPLPTWWLFTLITNHLGRNKHNEECEPYRPKLIKFYPLSQGTQYDLIRATVCKPRIFMTMNVFFINYTLFPVAVMWF